VTIGNHRPDIVIGEGWNWNNRNITGH
jgi:hypothetical protein